VFTALTRHKYQDDNQIFKRVSDFCARDPWARNTGYFNLFVRGHESMFIFMGIPMFTD
jgi:hypothetical protein